MNGNSENTGVGGFSIRLEPDLRQRLQTIAAKTDRSAADVIRHLIKRAVVTESGVQLTSITTDADLDLTDHPLRGDGS